MHGCRWSPPRLPGFPPLFLRHDISVSEAPGVAEWLVGSLATVNLTTVGSSTPAIQLPSDVITEDACLRVASSFLSLPPLFLPLTQPTLSHPILSCDVPPLSTYLSLPPPSLLSLLHPLSFPSHQKKGSISNLVGLHPPRLPRARDTFPETALRSRLVLSSSTPPRIASLGARRTNIELHSFSWHSPRTDAAEVVLRGIVRPLLS